MLQIATEYKEMAIQVTTDNANTRPHFFFALATRAELCPFEDKPARPATPEVPDDCCDDCIVLPALAEMGDPSDALKNDFFTAVYTRAIKGDVFRITIEKYNCDTGVWDHITDLVGNNVYGTFYDFGDVSEDTTGYKLDWNLVLNALGDGFYRLIGSSTARSGGTFNTLPFRLREFNQYRADSTVRFDWTMAGDQADMQNYQVRSDYGEGYDCSLRVSGRFGRMKVSYEPEDIELETGRVDRTSIRITPGYVFRSDRLFYLTHELLMFNAFPANDLKVTDYTLRTQYFDIISLPVRLAGEYSPGYEFQNRIIFGVQVEFQHRNWNFGRDQKCE